MGVGGAAGVRTVDLALLAVGAVGLVGDRFTWPLATQREHALVMTRLYRFVRPPSYAGAICLGD